MRITTQLSVPIKLDILESSIINENIKVGEITNSYFKDNKLWITISIDSKKIKLIKSLLKNIKGLISLNR